MGVLDNKISFAEIHSKVSEYNYEPKLAAWTRESFELCLLIWGWWVSRSRNFGISTASQERSLKGIVEVSTWRRKLKGTEVGRDTEVECRATAGSQGRRGF